LWEYLNKKFSLLPPQKCKIKSWLFEILEWALICICRRCCSSIWNAGLQELALQDSLICKTEELQRLLKAYLFKSSYVKFIKYFTYSEILWYLFFWNYNLLHTVWYHVSIHPWKTV
jgi:hypothetical protein